MTYLIGFLLSLIFSFYLTPKVKQWALRHKFVDQPGPRKIHQQPVARLGGMAVFLAFWLTIVIYLLFTPHNLQFTEKKFLDIDLNLWGVFLGAMVIFLSGIYDDIRGLSAPKKLFWQIVAGIIVVAFGVKIFWVHNPFGGLDIIINNWTYLLVPVWIVLLINVTNWWDGIDGQATGVGIIAAIVLFLLSTTGYVNQPSTALLMIILAGSLLGFLKFNFSPAKIFLGDSGSQFIGYMLAIGSIISGGKFATAALVLGFPILDALWVICRRLSSGKKPWTADRLHMHHRFLDLGFSPRNTALIMYVISALFGAVALLAAGRTIIKTQALFWLVGVMLIVSLILVFKKAGKNGKRH